jgi:hypothetical protein
VSCTAVKNTYTYILGQMSLFLIKNHTNKSIIGTPILCFPKKPYTLSGFEPASYVLQADEITIAPP